MSPAEAIAAAWLRAHDSLREAHGDDWSGEDHAVATAQVLLDAGVIRAPAAPEPRVLLQLPIDPATVAGWLQHPLDPEAL